MGGQWRSPSVRLDREWPRAQGAFVPHPCWQQLLPGTALISLPSPHLSFAEELQAQGRARGDAEKGECVQSAAPVLCARGSRGWVWVLVEDLCASMKASHALLPVFLWDGMLTNVSSLSTLLFQSP